MAFATKDMRCRICGSGRLEQNFYDLSWRCYGCGRSFSDATMRGWRQSYGGATEEEMPFENFNERVDHKYCARCRNIFAPKYTWQEQCWPCWLASPQGKAWSERKNNEANGFSGGASWWKERDTETAEKKREQAEKYAREEARRRSEEFYSKTHSAYDEFFRHADERQQQSRDYHGRYAKEEGCTIDSELLKRLIMLCHPDKHGGSELSNNVTKQLLAMKGKLK